MPSTIKFIIGLLLSTFGTFWAVGGLGIFKHGSSVSIGPAARGGAAHILAAWIGLSFVAIRLLARWEGR